MALSASDLDTRIQEEGKDLINQYESKRTDFLRDTCIELTTSQDYYWLYETLTLTVPATATDWFNIDDHFHKVEKVAYADGTDNNNLKWFDYVDERTYINDYYRIVNDTAGSFRLRWNATTKTFQMALINGPVAGSTIVVLVKKYFDDAELFPDFMEEVLVRGAVARFLAHLEGDDLEAAQHQFEEYRQQAKQQEKLGNNELNHAPRRVKTAKELDRFAQENNYRTNR